MVKFYVVMALFTGAYVARLNRPYGAGEIIACVGFALGWPLLWLMVLGHVFWRGLR